MMLPWISKGLCDSRAVAHFLLVWGPEGMGHVWQMLLGLVREQKHLRKIFLLMKMAHGNILPSVGAIACLYGSSVSKLKESTHTTKMWVQMNTEIHTIIPNTKARLLA